MIGTLISELTVLHTLGMKPNYSEIARKFNLDYRTVKESYKRVVDPSQIIDKKKRQSSLEPYRDIIKNRLSICGATIKAVWFYLTNEKICTCTYEALKKYVERTNIFNEITKARKNIAHVRYETDPGIQLQVDWIENLSIRTILGEIIYFNVFSATLGHSRLHFLEFSEGKTEVDLKRCLIDCFQSIGGLTKYVLTDNMSAAVSITAEGRKKHNSIIQFEKDLGIEIKLCKPRTPQTKGKVEVSNKFIKWIYAYDGKIKDKEDLKQKIRDITREANKQINQETGLAPIISFQKEKQYLRPLPNLNLTNYYQKAMNSRKVPDTLLIDFEGSKYSVPPNYIGKTVHYCKQNNQLYIYCNEELVTIHEISKQKINYNKDHYRSALIDKYSNMDDLDRAVEENLKKFKNFGENHE